MRPRVFPAEDTSGASRGSAAHRAGFNEAAGIPRGRRVRARLVAVDCHAASMRPRVFPAEDTSWHRAAIREHWGFNEAAGIPRGRHTMRLMGKITSSRFNEAAGIPRGRQGPRPRGARAVCPASMRPRVFPAEDSSACSGATAFCGCFNEAAGIPRGRLDAVPDAWHPGGVASMRPRVFPAEDPAGLGASPRDGDLALQ